MLRHFLRLSRRPLAVVLLYVWLISTGGHTIRKGLRHLVDRVDRRDLSIFQIGLRFIHIKHLKLLMNLFVIKAKTETKVSLNENTTSETLFIALKTT